MPPVREPLPEQAPLPPRQSRVPPPVRRQTDAYDGNLSTGLRLDPSGRPQPAIDPPLLGGVGLREPGAVSDAGSLRAHFPGPTLRLHQLGEAAEARVLAASGGRGVLAAYGGFDASRPPVVLVHGHGGSPADLADAARELDARGMQVFVFCYDDEHTRTHASGDQLAAALCELRQLYPTDSRLSLVGHSMGGIVIRCALNTLAQPGWYDGVTHDGAVPRAGFACVRVRTLDTAWTGYPHEPSFPLMAPLTEGVMTLLEREGAVDMRGSSQMFARLFDVALDGVELQNTAAEQLPGIRAPDAHRSIDDISPEGRRQLIDWLCGGPLPEDEAARHLGLSWRQDSRFASLQSRVRRDVHEGRLSRQDVSAAQGLLDAAHLVMPPVLGSHTSVLRQRPLVRDWVDTLADDLAPQ